jgi:hypothetical protein
MPQQQCIISDGVGQINVTVQIPFVLCEPLFPVQVDVAGLLPGTTLVLQNNAGDDLTVMSDGSYFFSEWQIDGSAYDVTVFSQPDMPQQQCIVIAGVGEINISVQIPFVQCELQLEVFENGFESLSQFKVLDYLDTLNQLSSTKIKPTYDFDCDCVIYDRFIFSLNGDYESDKILFELKNWIEEIKN